MNRLFEIHLRHSMLLTPRPEALCPLRPHKIASIPIRAAFTFCVAAVLVCARHVVHQF